MNDILKLMERRCEKYIPLHTLKKSRFQILLIPESEYAIRYRINFFLHIISLKILYEVETSLACRITVLVK